MTRLESTGTSPGIWTLDFGLWTLDFFYGLRMNQGYQLDHSLSQRLFKDFFDNVLLEHVGLIRVLPLAVHLFFTLSCLRGPSCLKVVEWVAHKIIETALSPNSSFPLGLDLGLGLGLVNKVCT